MLKLLRSYVFWTYERGTLHYDVMVTLILLFLFVAPHYIDFHDRPIPEVPGRSREALVRMAGVEGAERRFVYEFRADDLQGTRDPAELQQRLAAKVHEIAGPAEIEAIKPVRDPRGQIVAYDTVVRR